MTRSADDDGINTNRRLSRALAVPLTVFGYGLLMYVFVLVLAYAAGRGVDAEAFRYVGF